MSKQVRLVFFGEVLPGADPAAARQNLARALRVDPAQADSLFSGQRIVIKPELPETEAGRYIAHLAGLGVQVIAEPIADAAPPTSPFATAPPARPLNPASKASPFASAPTPVAGLAPVGAAAAAPAAAAAEIMCPACGTVQPKRTLCKQCGANIQALIDAKRDEAEFAAEVRKAEAEIKARKKAAGESDADSDTPKIFAFDLEGRMGRITYFLTGLLVAPIMLILVTIAAGAQNVLLMIAAIVLPLAFNLRAAILRCHDLNWSGWMLLLSLVPVVNLVFALVQLFMPGTAGPNNYGYPPGRSPTRHVMYALAFCVLGGAIAGYLGMSSARKLAELAAAEADAERREMTQTAPAPAVQREPMTDAAPAASTSPAEPGRKTWDGSINTIVIYTVGDCTPCIERRKDLARIGLWPREVRADLNEPASEEMVGKMVRAGLPISSMQMPVIDVNGTILNNPTVEQVEKYLR
jgi:uncharacterized membrane protein YhaH (DUF805 family)/glutaredoxin